MSNIAVGRFQLRAIAFLQAAGAIFSSALVDIRALARDVCAVGEVEIN